MAVINVLYLPRDDRLRAVVRTTLDFAEEVYKQGETNIRLGLHNCNRVARCGKEVRWSHRGRGPPALNCDAPRMGTLKRVMCVRPSGKPTNRPGEALGLLGMRGGGHKSNPPRYEILYMKQNMQRSPL
jgi:hypothetical protein